MLITMAKPLAFSKAQKMASLKAGYPFLSIRLKHSWVSSKTDYMIVKKLSDIVPQRVGDFTRWYFSKADPGHELSVRYIEVNGIVNPSHSLY